MAYVKNMQGKITAMHRYKFTPTDMAYVQGIQDEITVIHCDKSTPSGASLKFDGDILANFTITL